MREQFADEYKCTCAVGNLSLVIWMMKWWFVLCIAQPPTVSTFCDAEQNRVDLMNEGSVTRSLQKGDKKENKKEVSLLISLIRHPWVSIRRLNQSCVLSANAETLEVEVWKPQYKIYEETVWIWTNQLVVYAVTSAQIWCKWEKRLMNVVTGRRKKAELLKTKNYRIKKIS